MSMIRDTMDSKLYCDDLGEKGRKLTGTVRNRTNCTNA